MFFCSISEPPLILTLPEYEHHCGHCLAWTRRFQTVAQGTLISISLWANTSINLRDKPGGQLISGERRSRSLLTISPEGGATPVTVIPGNSVAGFDAMAQTTANKPQAASNSFVVIAAWAFNKVALSPL